MGTSEIGQTIGGSDVRGGAAKTCAHQWLIEAPNGPTSRGVCRLCGEVGEFRNSTEGSDWDFNPAIDSARETDRQLKRIEEASALANVSSEFL